MSWTKVGNHLRTAAVLAVGGCAWALHRRVRTLQLQLNALTDVAQDDVDAAMHRLRGRLRR